MNILHIKNNPYVLIEKVNIVIKVNIIKTTTRNIKTLNIIHKQNYSATMSICEIFQ
jgi:hypothetical protein